MIWWKLLLLSWLVKKILKNKEVRKVLRGVARNILIVLAGLLESDLIDFKWDIDKYQSAFRKLDTARTDEHITDEELGDVLEALAENVSSPVRQALFAVGGLLKSRLIDFKWNSRKYAPIFDELNKMRADPYFTDEEFAGFARVLAETLK